MKGASLSYEDEKFSYVAFTREDCGRAAGRIVRRPEHKPGLIQLTVCRGNCVTRERVARSSPHFRAARRARWGDAWVP